MEVTFDAAVNENAVDQYRLFIVKDVNAGTFDEAAAQAVTFPNYTIVNTNGSPNYSVNLAFSATDTDGDPIAMNTDYRAFVLSIADGVNTSTDTLSSASAVVNLQLPSSPATAVSGSDNDDMGSGTDMEVLFDAAASENLVGEYRVMAVKSANSGLFDLAAAQAVSNANYTVVAPNGSANYSTVLAGANDVDGDALGVSTEYNVFVLSIADGVIASTDTISAASPNVQLDVRVNSATNVVGADADNNLDASDAEITFDAATEEFRIASYRIMITKNGASFDAQDAANVAAADYTEVTADGSSSYSMNLAAGATDVDGDPVAQSSLYRAYIYSIANGTDGNIDSLSAASDAFELVNTVGIADRNELDLDVFSSGKMININGLTSGTTAHVHVMNVKGQTIRIEQSPDNRMVIDMNAAASGVYILHIEEDGKSFVQRLSVH